MRVSEKTLRRGMVGMGWWVIGLLVDAYNTTRQEQFHVTQSASAQNSCSTVVGGIRRGRGVVLVYQLVQTVNNKCKKS